MQFFSCTFKKNVVILQRKPEQSDLQTYYKSVYYRLFWYHEIW